ncbi:MAG: hypothetical protein O2909_01845 [Chloroflexi bacterium]|nr:hypothetical protein [Chloroflexota bacterium]MDA1218170.1 hypothetical protein [Chloroflexota bacterium]
MTAHFEFVEYASSVAPAKAEAQRPPAGNNETPLPRFDRGGLRRNDGSQDFGIFLYKVQVRIHHIMV